MLVKRCPKAVVIIMVWKCPQPNRTLDMLQMAVTLKAKFHRTPLSLQTQKHPWAHGVVSNRMTQQVLKPAMMPVQA